MFPYTTFDYNSYFPLRGICQVPTSRVALFNINGQSNMGKEALSFGCKGVFFKEDSLELTEKGILSILNGKLWFSRGVLQDLVIEVLQAGHSKENIPNILTLREEEILFLITSGATNKEIAQNLCLSPHTIRGHVSNIFTKIEVGNRLKAVLWAKQFLHPVKKLPSKNP